MSFQSILFTAPGAAMRQSPATPDFLVDLNLDQIVDAITAEKSEYELKPFFLTPLHDLDAVDYRHAVFRDLEDTALFDHLTAFAQAMRTMRERLAQAEKLHYISQKQRWFLDAVAVYCDGVKRLARVLSQASPDSEGLQAFSGFLRDYVATEVFSGIVRETQQLKADLSAIRYCVRIKGGSVRVRKYAGEADYSADIIHTFEKFRQAEPAEYEGESSDYPDMNQVEARILDQVAKLYPEILTRLESFCEQHRDYLNETIRRFDREIQFYLGYLTVLARFKKSGLVFCYPQLSETDKTLHSREGFDLALAYKLLEENTLVVTNDFYLQGEERIIVVSGPNQGGKTTFARTFGQLHYLASLGCPVPGREARLFFCDQVLTHFEREEHIQNLRGKLEDDLVRMHAILEVATPDSVIVINEIFSSTTTRDALDLGEKVLCKIIERGALCVCVTFIDELASLGKTTVSMASTVQHDNPAVRTYKVIRKPADGLAYALSIAEKYRLTYDALQARL